MCAVEWESSYFHKDEKSRNATEEKTDLIPQQVSLNASAVLGSVQLGRWEWSRWRWAVPCGKLTCRQAGRPPPGFSEPVRVEPDVPEFLAHQSISIIASSFFINKFFSPFLVCLGTLWMATSILISQFLITFWYLWNWIKLKIWYLAIGLVRTPWIAGSQHTRSHPWQGHEEEAWQARQIRTSGISKSCPGAHLKDDLCLYVACYIRLLPNFCDMGRRPSLISLQTEST